MPSEGFLSRWSRRKRGLDQGEEAAAAPPAAPPAPAAAPAPPAESPAPRPASSAEGAPPAEAEPEFDLSSLPDIDSITATTDIRGFFHKAVPEALRQAALRKAWATDPVISTYMGPLDYAWDFNAPGGLPFGFSSELGEVGEALRDLIAQAVGEPPPRPDVRAEAGPGAAPQALVAADDTAPEAETAAVDPPVEPPPSPVRPAAAEPDAADVEPSSAEAAAPAPPPRRRHGGAVPI
ncbi:MAG: DUF3306 domain-containing protein [Roseococcus sp.]|nr:DUF3306 domain-containing protein [Roseococcus sp.]